LRFEVFVERFDGWVVTDSKISIVRWFSVSA